MDNVPARRPGRQHPTHLTSTRRSSSPSRLWLVRQIKFKQPDSVLARDFGFIVIVQLNRIEPIGRWRDVFVRVIDGDCSVQKLSGSSAISSI